jgi:hypothetical protein
VVASGGGLVLVCVDCPTGLTFDVDVGSALADVAAAGGSTAELDVV